MKLPFSPKETDPKAKRVIAVKGGSYSAAVTALVLAILVAVNVLFSVLPASLTKHDITSTQLYSITGNTRVVVNGLEQDVTIYWIVQSEQEDSVLENLLEKYESLSEHIEVVKKNPDVYPAFAAQYTDDTVYNNSLVVTCGDKYRYISYTDIYLTDVDYTTYSYVYSFDGEGAITSAIDYVISEELPLVYVLEGHGEAELPDELQTQIQKANIELASYSLLTADELPTDADALLIYAPATDLSDREAELLTEYLDAGGKLMVLVSPTESGTLTNLASVSEHYGIQTVDGLVMEDDRNYYAFGFPYILLPELEEHNITSPLINSRYYAIFPLAQGYDLSNSTAEALLSTSYSAFSKADGLLFDSYELEEDDLTGPFTLAFTVDTDNGGQLVWFGSAYFLEELYNAYSSGANLDLAMNALSSLIGEREAVSIRSKSLSYNYLTISDSTASFLKTWMIGILPAIFVLYGVMTVIDRRKQRHD